MKSRVLRSVFALALVGSASSLTLLTASAPAHAFSWSDLDPTNKNSAVRKAGRYIDLSNKNSGLSHSTVGRFVNRVGRAVDPFNPQRNGGMWQKLDITDPNQPISQFCKPIAQYGTQAATTYFSGSPQAGMMAGGAAPEILCGGGSNYGASRNSSRSTSQQEEADNYNIQPMGFEEFKKQNDYLDEQKRKEWDRQRNIIEAENQREREHDLRMKNMERARGGGGLGSMMEMQRRPLRLPSF